MVDFELIFVCVYLIISTIDFRIIKSSNIPKKYYLVSFMIPVKLPYSKWHMALSKVKH